MKTPICFLRQWSGMLFKMLVVICLTSSCSKTEDPKVEPLTACTSKNMNAYIDDQHYNLNVFFTGSKTSICGYLEFRQATDNAQFIHFDVWVHNLEPNTNYKLQRAVDTMLDGNCTGTDWLTLGKGTNSYSITTDGKGEGFGELYRSITAIPVGSKFDIRFQIVKESDSSVALTSDCYLYTVR